MTSAATNQILKKILVFIVWLVHLREDGAFVDGVRVVVHAPRDVAPVGEHLDAAAVWNDERCSAGAGRRTAVGRLGPARVRVGTATPELHAKHHQQKQVRSVALLAENSEKICIHCQHSELFVVQIWHA